MKIASGKLDRKLTLYRATSTRQPGGQIIKAWTLIATVYAQRLEMRTVDSARAGQRDTYSMGRYLIRYRSDITTADRLVEDGTTYDILAKDEPDRRTTMVLTVEEATGDPIVVA